MNVYLPNGRLPSAYQEVEYIQSSNTQYINTGVINQWTTLTVDMKFIITQTNPSGYEDGFFGAKGSSTQSPTIYLPTHATKTLNTWCGSETAYTITSNFSLNVLHTLTVNYSSSGRTGVYDGTSFSSSAGLSNSANNTSGYMCFFSDGPTPVSKCYMKLYSAKITVNGTLVRDLVPCYRKSDSVIGLYDLVNNQFYTNSGTGTFTKGSNVTPELKNAYIGEVWTPGSNTIAYFPFIDNQNDVTGNYTLNITGTKQTIGYQFSSGSNSFVAGVGSVKTVRFMSYWCKMDVLTSSAQETSTGGMNKGGFRYIWSHTGYSSANKAFCFVNSSSSFVYSSHQDTTIGTWYHIAYGADDNGNYKAWLNGTLVWSGTSTIKTYTDFSFRLLLQQNVTATFSDLIVEDSLWSSAEVTHYFDLTKANYGIS